MINEEILRAKASKKGLTITALEQKAGIANGAIGKWFLHGSTPNVETLKKVADVLGCRIDNLLVKEGD